MCQAFYVKRCWLVRVEFKLTADSASNVLTVNGQTPLDIVSSFDASGADSCCQHLSGVGL